MSFRGDDRGQSVQLGAVLLFGFLIVGLSVYQASVVPQQNAAAEYRHSQQVQEDMQHLRNSMVRAAAGSEPVPRAVKLGTTYPQRFVAVNPAPPSGTLRTTEPRDIDVSGAAGAIPLVCPDGAHDRSRALTYDADYNAYDDAPRVVYEHTVVYKQFVSPESAANEGELNESTLRMSSHRLVNGDRINLLPLVGAYSRTGIGAVNVEPRMGPTRRTAVTDPTLTFNTSMTAGMWEAMLDSVNSVTYVASETPYPFEDGVARVTLAFSGEYTLACTPVALSNAGDIPTDGNQASSLAYDSGSVSYSNGELSFDIENTGDSEVTLAGFSVATDQASRLRDRDADQPEVTVASAREARADRPSAPPGVGFDTDGTPYDFIRDSSDGQGQSGVLSANSGPTQVTIKDLLQSDNRLATFGNLDETSDPSTAVLSVTFYLGDGSTKTFYFR